MNSSTNLHDYAQDSTARLASAIATHLIPSSISACPQHLYAVFSLTRLTSSRLRRVRPSFISLQANSDQPYSKSRHHSAGRPAISSPAGHTTVLSCRGGGSGRRRLGCSRQPAHAHHCPAPGRTSGACQPPSAGAGSAAHTPRDPRSQQGRDGVPASSAAGSHHGGASSACRAHHRGSVPFHRPARARLHHSPPSCGLDGALCCVVPPAPPLDLVPGRQPVASSASQRDDGGWVSSIDASVGGHHILRAVVPGNSR
jgi:hypothetical protein